MTENGKSNEDIPAPNGDKSSQGEEALSEHTMVLPSLTPFYDEIAEPFEKALETYHQGQEQLTLFIENTVDEFEEHVDTVLKSNLEEEK